MNQTSGAYLITNLVNGKVYVGSTGKSLAGRWWRHKHTLRKGTHRNSHLQRAWNKYGEAAFVCETLVECPPRACLQVEQLYIDLLDATSSGGCGYNIAAIAGSNLGQKRSEETCKRISDAQRGKHRVFTAEHKAALSKALKGLHAGETRSPEWCARQSRQRKGVKFSESHKANIAEGQRKRWAGAKVAKPTEYEYQEVPAS